jgi:hypothetical protein
MAIVATEGPERPVHARKSPRGSSARSGASAKRRGPEGRVQRLTNNLSPAPGTWSRMDWLRQNSAMPRQRKCGLRVHSDMVSAKRKGKSITFGGLMLCGCRRCPSCSGRLARALRDDITKAAQTWRDAGERVLFGTMTIRHDRSQSLAELADAVSACWHAATGGKSWMRDRQRHGVHHWIRIWEEKWSPANGWHVHVHFLLFADRRKHGKVLTASLLGSMFDRWRSKAVSLGLGTPLYRAQDLHEVTAQGAAELAGYFSKQTTSAGEWDAEGIGYEMSSPSTKTGGGMTPEEILLAAMDGDLQMLALWREYERAMKGRRTVAYSRGLREALSLGEELTAEQIEAREESEGAVIVAQMTPRAWKKLVTKPGRRAEFANRLIADGAGDAVAWLAEWGIAAVVGRMDRQSEPVRFVPTSIETAKLPF